MIGKLLSINMRNESRILIHDLYMYYSPNKDINIRKYKLIMCNGIIVRVLLQNNKLLAKFCK